MTSKTKPIKIGQVGRITLATDQAEIGHYVKVENDAENTGGFLILMASDAALRADGSDNWVETPGDLEAFFRESGWEVEWLPVLNVKKNDMNNPYDLKNSQCA